MPSPLFPLTFTFLTPASIVSTEAPVQFGLLESITAAMGRQVQLLNGVPMTRVRVDFAPGDVALRVESTLGFPPSGRVRSGGLLLAYTGITASAFTGVTNVNGLERVKTLGILTEVTPDIPTAPVE